MAKGIDAILAALEAEKARVERARAWQQEQEARRAKMSLLERLEDSRVVSFEPLPDGSVKIEEACDCYFSETLSRDELIQLIAELQALVRAPAD